MSVTPINGLAAAQLAEPDWRRLIPDPVSPDGMGPEWRAEAKRHWLRVTAEMRDAGTLVTANDQQIKRLVIAYLRFDFAAAKVLAVGAVAPSPRTAVPQHNLWRDELRAADHDATAHEMELGITPRRRGAVTKAARQQRKASAADGYLNRAKA